MSTYYVDYTGGNDENDGLSEENAWKTWNKVQTDLNGDQSDDIVKAKCGETWRETYTVAGYGTSGHLFKHDYYGSGDLPKIYQSSDQLSGWSQYSGNIYSKTGFDYEPTGLFLDGECYTKAANEDSVNSTDRWYRDGGTNTMYIYSVGDPSSYYSEIERSQGNYCLRIDGKSYLEFNNMDFRYSSSQNVSFAGTHSYIDFIDCYIQGVSLAGLAGPNGGTGSYITLDNVTIHGMNRSAYNNCVEWEASNSTLKNCEISRGSHAGLCIQLTDSVVEYNELWSDGYGNNYYGRNIDMLGGSGTHIRYNLVRNPGYGNGIVENTEQFTGDGHEIYYNIFKAGEYQGVQIYKNASYETQNIKFYNNVVYGSKGIGFYAHTATASSNNYVRNNLIFGNDSTNHYQVAILDPNQRPKFTFENNCIWDSATTSVVSDQGAHTVAWMDTQYGTWNNNISSDPKCVNSSGGDFRLENNSPCIGRGKNLGLTLDFSGATVPLGNYPDIGAYEWNAGAIISEGIKMELS